MKCNLIVTIGCDTGERYLSHPLFADIGTPSVDAILT
jgi:hypothetical protein